jgi:glycosyltransferase involved in cell wall biosynthesis
MKILFLCGVFAKENEDEILRHAKRPVEYSANLFQEKMVGGFREFGDDFSVVSAPFIGSYPNASDLFSFKGFEAKQDKYQYVPFCNLWGFRNSSRKKSLKKALREFIASDDSEKLIVVYSPHTPFVQAAAYAKKKDPRIKICLVVPDLPQYMNLNAKISLLYKLGKRYDIAKFEKANRSVDSYMVLTEPMKDPLHIGNRPYIVVEGIVDQDVFEQNRAKKAELKADPSLKYIVYTGKLYEKFGVKNLVDTFLTMEGEDLRLVLCGCGDLDSYVQEKTQEDPRIMALGQVKPDIAHQWVLKASVLVNPRANDEEYTKYSFPSKNIEYLASGNPVVAYKLDGLQDHYEDYMIFAETGLEGAIRKALAQNDNEDRARKFEVYATERLSAEKVADRILAMDGKK